MKPSSTKQTTVTFDERQKQFVLKSYQYGFWFMIAVLWLEIISQRWFPIFSADFMSFLALWGGVTVYVCYAALHGAHPLVDQRFGKWGGKVGLPLALLSLIFLVVVLWICIDQKLGWKEFFARGGSGSAIVLNLSIICMGASVAYRNYLNKKEEEE